ncbi:hypothetical protein Pcaca04_14550 [Pectobacterium carotovorum subsp. carotovorum]|nr:hypothetical protein Pcaca04_14550 [Pectobacterium carotovorum subsp. carotovorum]
MAQRDEIVKNKVREKAHSPSLISLPFEDNLPASIRVFSLEFSGLNKSTYEEKTNNIVKSIEWIK